MGTPERVTDAYLHELLDGYAVDVAALVDGAACAAASTAASEIVAVRDVAVQTMCPHHLLPGLGTATVAYMPGERLLGIGALARLVEAFARRLTLQETIGREVVATLMTRAGARGAYCRLDMHHTCLSCRGARKVTAVVTTAASAGELALPAGEARLFHLLASTPRVAP